MYTAVRVIASLRSADRPNLDNKVGSLAYCAQITKSIFFLLAALQQRPLGYIGDGDIWMCLRAEKGVPGMGTKGVDSPSSPGLADVSSLEIQWMEGGQW